jgi:hypothetical protein
MSIRPSEAPAEREYPHWNRVYAGVILFTIVTIVALWLFSRAFTPSWLR